LQFLPARSHLSNARQSALLERRGNRRWWLVTPTIPKIGRRGVVGRVDAAQTGVLEWANRTKTRMIATPMAMPISTLMISALMVRF
jgi:hypothetical protein